MKTTSLAVLEASTAVVTSPSLYSIVLGQYEDDTPVSWDTEGNVLSRFGDTVWDYSAWAERSERIHFDRDDALSQSDVWILKTLCALALFGPKTSSLRTIRYAFYEFQRFARYLTDHGQSLSTCPDTGKAITKYLKRQATGGKEAGQLKFFCRLAHYNPDVVSWTPPPLSIFNNSTNGLDEDPKRQTLYIPSAVYESILDQSIAQLESFLAISENFTRFCAWLDQHSTEFWARPGSKTKTIRPLNNGMFGSHFFENKTKEYGLYDWIRQNNPPRKKINSQDFFTAVKSVRQAALAALSASTFMRIGEVLSVRLNGLNKDYDDRIGPIFYVRGITTKTKKQRNAVWTTSADSELCFKACRLINETYFKHFYKNADRTHVLDNLGHLPLFIQLPQPMQHSNASSKGRADVTLGRFYGHYLSEYLKPCLPLNAQAIEELLAVNTDYGADEFEAGSNLPLAHHQFRRTGLVRAAASGVVSHPSLTYQAKHLDPKHTGYYQAGYLQSILDATHHSHGSLRNIVEQLDDSVEEDFQKEYFEALMWSHNDMKSNTGRFFSPYGDKHLAKLVNELEILSWGEFKRRERLKVARRTLLGACLKDGYCEYGTAESVKGCVHHDDDQPCANAIYDVKKHDLIVEHLEDVRSELGELEETDENQLLRESLIADEKAAVKALDDIHHFLESV